MNISVFELETQVTRFLFVAVFMSVFTHMASGQRLYRIDSLNNLISSTNVDTVKVLALINLSKEYKIANPDSAMTYSLEAMRIAKEAKFTKGVAAAYYSLGDIEVSRDATEQAKLYLLESVKYYQQSDIESELPRIYITIGTLHSFRDELIEALDYFQKALGIAEKLQLRQLEVQVNNNLGAVYKSLGKFDKALACFNRALEISTKMGLKDEIYYLYGNLGILNATMGDMELAESYFIKVLQLSRENGDEVAEAFALVSLGDYYIDLKNYRQALSFYELASGKIDVVNANYTGPKSYYLANVYSGIGTAQFELKNYSAAIGYLTKGYEIASESGLTSIVAKCADNLSYAYEYRNQTEEALKFARIHQAMKDSLQNMDVVRKVTERDMQNKFDQLMAEKEFEQTLNDIAQNRNKTFYLMMIGGSVLGLVIFMLLFLLQINKNKRVRLESVNLQLEKEKLNNDLAYKNKELTTNVMYLLRKNELILSVTDKLKKAKMSFKLENRKLVEDVIRDLEAASKGDIWKEFELRFQEVHSDFYKKLNEMFPDLSPNELKLCAFLRLNMSTKDIAAITFMSVNSINIARHRLRKKLNIEQDENLITFLSSL